MNLNKIKSFILIQIILISSGLLTQSKGQNNNGLWTSNPPDTVTTNRQVLVKKNLNVTGNVYVDTVKTNVLKVGKNSLWLGTWDVGTGNDNFIFSDNGALYIQCEAGNFNTIFNWDVATNSNLGNVGIGTETPFGTPALPATSGIFGLEVNNDINLTSQQLGHGYRLGGHIVLQCPLKIFLLV